MNRVRLRLVHFTCLVLLIVPPALGDFLHVTELSPARHAVSAPIDAPIRIDFDRPLDPATISLNNLRVFGKSSGPKAGTWQLEMGDRSLVFHPTASMSAGELVTVMISDQIAAANGDVLRPGGYTFQYYTATQATGPFSFQFRHIMSTGADTIPYGGVANDFNRDGFLDIGAVNEGTGDLRIFLNQADGSGLFADYLQPPTPLRTGASPSEAQDFNSDGLVDLAVSNSDGTLSVVLGEGTGSLAPQQVIPAAGFGHHSGIATLDVEGDGDVDIVRSAADIGSALYLFLNNGQGVFSPAMEIESSQGKRGLTAGDMNNDGLQDLIVSKGNAGWNVFLANGDGTFSPVTNSPDRFQADQVAVGDLNGDGNLDVSTPERLFLGNGDGTLTYLSNTTGQTATDLGDFDGDGDLDLIVSGGSQRIFLNDGLANFTPTNLTPVGFANNQCAC